MFKIALHGSSFVSSQVGYQPPGSWDECVTALSQYFQPIATFEQRFDDLLTRVKELGFSCMDVWQPAELNWQWATLEHIEIARRVIDRQAMVISSLAGEFGTTREEFDSACRLASAIGAPMLSGTTALLLSDRNFVIDRLEAYDLRLAIENEVEETPQQILQQIGDTGGGRLGTALDTGWWATHHYDVVKAITELKEHLFHVHLKDVLPGDEHINCGCGKGCVPVVDCVETLMKMDYSGILSIENHALDHDPGSELAAGRKLVEKMISS